MDTHRFFANALAYTELHPLLEEYAREAMKEFEWYEDTEDEKTVMPGSYAVFGLGLSSERYFPLVETYMGLVDDEHQLVHDKFIIQTIYLILVLLMSLIHPNNHYMIQLRS